MHSRIILTMMTAAIIIAGGCRKTYEHERLGRDSERFAQVSRMIRTLREVGQEQGEGEGEESFDAVFSRQAADDLDQGRLAMLRASLEQVASAEQAELVRVDAFGRDIFRATVKLSSGGTLRSLAVLLVVSDGRMYWMGTN